MWQYHPFTLTSAPEEDYLSVHIRCGGNFTKSLAKAVGCSFEERKRGPDVGSEVVGLNDDTEAGQRNSAIRRILPRLHIDGPFGSASEDVFKYEIAILVGAGIGVTPFASILKSVWYRMNYPKEKTRLNKVYFFWICRDFDSFEWFRSLLMAIEAQDMNNHIEIHTVSFRYSISMIHLISNTPTSTSLRKYDQTMQRISCSTTTTPIPTLSRACEHLQISVVRIGTQSSSQSERSIRQPRPECSSADRNHLVVSYTSSATCTVIQVSTTFGERRTFSAERHPPTIFGALA